MNREIKFRAWDNENKYMVTSKQGVFTALRNSMNIVRQDDGYYNDGDLLKPNKEKYTLMQFTGMFDKNGKEIYEGDIILTQPLKDKPFPRKARSKRLRGIVKYQVLCGQNFIGEPDEVKYWGAEWGIEIIDKKDYEKYNNYGWGLFFECEVIGNIYDNPELLGGE